MLALFGCCSHLGERVRAGQALVSEDLRVFGAHKREASQRLRANKAAARCCQRVHVTPRTEGVSVELRRTRSLASAAPPRGARARGEELAVEWGSSVRIGQGASVLGSFRQLRAVPAPASPAARAGGDAPPRRRCRAKLAVRRLGGRGREVARLAACRRAQAAAVRQASSVTEALRPCCKSVASHRRSRRGKRRGRPAHEGGAWTGGRRLRRVGPLSEAAAPATGGVQGASGAHAGVACSARGSGVSRAEPVLTGSRLLCAGGGRATTRQRAVHSRPPGPGSGQAQGTGASQAGCESHQNWDFAKRRPVSAVPTSSCAFHGAALLRAASA